MTAEHMFTHQLSLSFYLSVTPFLRLTADFNSQNGRFILIIQLALLIGKLFSSGLLFVSVSFKKRSLQWKIRLKDLTAK